VVEGLTALRVALIYCGNGLGHAKRSVRILNRLLEQQSAIRSVVIFCDTNTSKELSKWRQIFLLRDRCALEVAAVSVPLRWNPNADYYSEWLLTWHRAIPSWDLQNFDYVLSDNLVEPLFYSKRVILIGSFFWHDVLFSAFSENKYVAKYKLVCQDLLAAAQPHMIANRYFATPAVNQQTTIHKVGLIPFCRVRTEERPNSLPLQVLIALGGARASDGVVNQLNRATRRLSDFGMKLFGSPALAQSLGTGCPEIEPFDFWDDNLDAIDLAIVRGGLGTISDCIAARVPMLYVDDSNPEIRFNHTRINQLQLGFPLESCLDEGTDIFTNPSVYARTLSNIAGFGLKGDVEAAEILGKLCGIGSHW
jgi:hypothetical protein